MAKPIQLLGLSGSLRRDSHTRAVLRAAARQSDGAVVDLFEGIGDLPYFNEDDEGERTPQSVIEFRRRIAESDGLVVVTPEYNGSLPGVLKNALDWASRPFGNTPIVGKPALVIGASTSPFGASWAQEHTRKALQLSGARVYEQGQSVGKVADLIADDGELAHDETESELRGLLEDFAEWAEAPPEIDDSF